ncbi:MAG: hypothetical protein NTW19_01025 [Planctomycetota bacterium]|nr:hypothetical protein [Planctomycetota bacterium]
MNSTQKACCILMASAFVLAALLLVTLQERFTARAEASPLIIARENITAMTAKTRINQESLLVLDNASQKLLIYDLDVAKQRMNLIGETDLSKLFAPPGGGAGPGRATQPPGRTSR